MEGFLFKIPLYIKYYIYNIHIYFICLYISESYIYNYIIYMTIYRTMNIFDNKNPKI